MSPRVVAEVFTGARLDLLEISRFPALVERSPLRTQLDEPSLTGRVLDPARVLVGRRARTKIEIDRWWRCGVLQLEQRPQDRFVLACGSPRPWKQPLPAIRNCGYSP